MDFVTVTFDRLACLVEEVTIHLLKRRFPGVVSLTELPLARRPEERPERFRVTVAEGGMPPWVIAYHASRFEDTERHVLAVLQRVEQSRSDEAHRLNSGSRLCGRDRGIKRPTMSGALAVAKTINGTSEIVQREIHLLLR
jgi:hypothetical protein